MELIEPAPILTHDTSFYSGLPGESYGHRFESPIDLTTELMLHAELGRI